MKMDAEHTSLLASEKRKRRVDDVDKRREYRIAHGLEEPAESDGGAVGSEGKEAEGEEERKKRSVKKWLGIW
jgi:hypothetical protein